MNNYPPEIEDLIPIGFCLKNYDKSKTLDTTQWHDNIRKRATINSFLKDKVTNEHVIAGFKIRNQQNIEEGFLTEDSGKIGSDFDLYGEFFYSMTKTFYKNLDDMFLMNNPVHDDLNEHFRLKHMNLALAVMDLDTPDEILLRSFKEWLKKIRKNRAGTPKQKIITESVLRRWQSNRVIEYLDLSQWYLLRGKRLKANQAGAILFPDDYSRDRGEVIRKTIKKDLIPEMLSVQTLNALLAQGLEAEWKENI